MSKTVAQIVQVAGTHNHCIGCMFDGEGNWSCSCPRELDCGQESIFQLDVADG